jgi:hypothetical protein
MARLELSSKVLWASNLNFGPVPSTSFPWFWETSSGLLSAISGEA